MEQLVSAEAAATWELVEQLLTRKFILHPREDGGLIAEVRTVNGNLVGYFRITADGTIQRDRAVRWFQIGQDGPLEARFTPIPLPEPLEDAVPEEHDA